MNLNTQRRLASNILFCGQNRVWIDPDKLSDVEEAITRDDIRQLIKSGVIKAKRKQGIARVVKTSRRGPGSIKGRVAGKGKWLSKVRPLRRMLKKLRDEGMPKSEYRKLYYLVKGGFFRDRPHLKLYLEKARLESNSAVGPAKESKINEKEVSKSGKRTNVQGRVPKKA